MRKNMFTILLVLSVGISLPGMWKKLLLPPITAYELETVPETANEITETADEIIGTTDEIVGTADETPEIETDYAAPPQPDTFPGTFIQVDRSYWSDALFIGDSRTIGLSEYADLGEADVFADSGMSVYKLFSAKVHMKSGKMTLEEVLTQRQYGKIYLTLGINELGYDYQKTVEKYREAVEKIHTLQPQATLFLGANLHVTRKKSTSDPIYNNAAIDRVNQAIANAADQKTCFYLDVNELFDDAEGNLDASYTADDAHVLGKYYTVWADWLLTKGI